MVLKDQSLSSSFVFATCHIGFENILKKEFEVLHPNLRPSFSKKGFVTFKSLEPLSSFKTPSIFALTYGLSLGNFKNSEDLPKILEKFSSPPFFHVWNITKDNDEEKTVLMWDTLREKFKLELNTLCDFSIPKDKQWVFDLIQLEDSFWYGVHQHVRNLPKCSGGRSFEMKDTPVPSRAYYKIKEISERYNLKFKPKETALEIGAAPGGACSYLLENNLKVFGLDRGKIHESVLKNPDFKHLSYSFHEIDQEKLPPKCHWLLIDINAEPQVTLNALKKFHSFYKRSLKGVIFNLKLNHETFIKDLSKFKKQIESLDFKLVEFKQTFFNRKEISVIAIK